MAVFHSDDFTTVDFDSGRELVWVLPNPPELNFAGTFAGTFTHHIHNLLLHKQFEVEPMAGIVRLAGLTY
jgi:hypothetical protein